MRVLLLIPLLLATIRVATAQTEPIDSATSPVFGFRMTPCPGGSDTVVAVPFERPATYRGRLDSLAPDGSLVIALASGDPGFGENTLAETHFLRFTRGPAAGRHYPIAGNVGAAIQLAVPVDHPPLNASSGDELDLVPYWTPATLFPPASQTALHPSGGLLPKQRGSELLVYPAGAVAENASPERIYFLTSDGAWREAAAGLPIATDAALPPHAVLVIRHPEGAADTVFQPAALVTATPSTLTLHSRRGTALDHFIGLNRPVPSLLNQHDNLASALAPSPGLSPAQRRDLLLVFDNALPGRDRAPDATYFRHRGDWYRVSTAGQPPVPANDAPLPAGASLIIRKAPTLNPQTTLWTQEPNL